MIRSDEETLVAAMQQVRQMMRRYRRRTSGADARKLADEVLTILDAADVQEARMRIDRRHMFRVLENAAVRRLEVEVVPN